MRSGIWGAFHLKAKPIRRTSNEPRQILLAYGPGAGRQILEATDSVKLMENGAPDFGRPPWMPSSDVLPAIVPVGRFLLRAERMIVALSHLSVYPNGCMLDVRASARGRDAASDVFEHLVFIAQFGAETTAVMHDKTAPRWRPDGKPALVLMQYGVQGDVTAVNESDRKADCTLRLWLYPLPPPEPGTLSIDSPGPSAASCPLDGRAIVAAATNTQPYWR